MWVWKFLLTFFPFFSFRYNPAFHFFHFSAFSQEIHFFPHAKNDEESQGSAYCVSPREIPEWNVPCERNCLRLISHYHCQHHSHFIDWALSIPLIDYIFSYRHFQGYSTSQTFYAVLDMSTNYCNLRNLLTGSGLDQSQVFTETTSNSICTQYSSANCGMYWHRQKPKNVYDAIRGTGRSDLLNSSSLTLLRKRIIGNGVAGIRLVPRQLHVSDTKWQKINEVVWFFVLWCDVNFLIPRWR